MQLVIFFIFEKFIDSLYKVSSVLFFISSGPLDYIIILLKISIHGGVVLEVMELLFNLCEFSF